MKKTNKINLDLGWPCYACRFNNRESTEFPCMLCTKNVLTDRTIEEYKNYFEPILEPK